MSEYLHMFFFQAEDGIRYLVRSRGLGDVYKRQDRDCGGRAGGTGIAAREAVRRCNEDALTRIAGRGLSLIHI